MKAQVRIIAMVFLALTGLTVSAQTYPAGMQAHGNNSSGVPSADEAVDSVTIGGTLDYFVMPDATINPGYNYSVNPLTNLTSTFDWSGTTGNTSLLYKKSGPTDIPNYVQIVWGNIAGLYQVSVAEQAAAGCADPTPTIIPIRLIGLPTLTYPVAGGNQAYCSTSADGSTNIAVSPLTVNFSSSVSGNKLIQLRYTITSTSHGTIASNVLATVTATSATAGTFSIASALNYYDSYTITLTEVTDRIARKSNVTGAPSGNLTYTVYVNKAPNTGIIYHLPNQ
ncbi:MAG: hypothetical protein U0T82_07145 [Bacteroidales bacterium]